MARRSHAFGLGLLFVLAGCRGPGLPTYRALHVVDGQTVYSPPVASSAYAAYLRARLAMASDPPRLPEARQWIQRALRADPADPHLWTTRGEIEARLGQRDHARASAQRALTLRPGYPPAQQLLAAVEARPVDRALATQRSVDE